jgi:hypothetical protein
MLARDIEFVAAQRRRRFFRMYRIRHIMFRLSPALAARLGL